MINNKATTKRKRSLYRAIKRGDLGFPGAIEFSVQLQMCAWTNVITNELFKIHLEAYPPKSLSEVLKDGI